MNKVGLLLLLTTTTIILTSTFFSINASAGQAGVGVLNVPPKFAMVRIVQQDDSIRVYLTVSDYNSWEDIYAVRVILEDYGTETAEFLFKQYEDTTSYNKINEFSETSGGTNLLTKEKCSYGHSDKKETVAERCNFELLFVFHVSWFSNLNIIVEDREGLTATMDLNYNTGELMRRSDIIVIPGLYDPIYVKIPPYLLTLLALILGVLGIIIFIRKIDKKRVAYEKG